MFNILVGTKHLLAIRNLTVLSHPAGPHEFYSMLRRLDLGGHAVFIICIYNYVYRSVYTFWMSKPIAKFSPLPSFSRDLLSFCCRQIKTSSSGFFTSNTYCRKAQSDASAQLQKKHYEKVRQNVCPCAHIFNYLLVNGLTFIKLDKLKWKLVKSKIRQ